MLRSAVSRLFHYKLPFASRSMASLEGAGIGGRRPPRLTVPWRPDPVDRKDMPFLHHGRRPRFTGYEKFKTPRKRANILIRELRKEAVEKSIAKKPEVFQVDFEVGDAVEVVMVEEGGIHSEKYSKYRGIIIGIYRSRGGVDHSMLIRDVIMGEPLETLFPLHSPLLRSIKILQKNFLHRGKKRVRRAKLYYLRGRKLSESTVTGVKFRSEQLEKDSKQTNKKKGKKKKKKKK